MLERKVFIIFLIIKKTSRYNIIRLESANSANVNTTEITKTEIKIIKKLKMFLYVFRKNEN